MRCRVFSRVLLATQKLIEEIFHFQQEIFDTEKRLFERLLQSQQPKSLFITCSASQIDSSLLTQTQPGHAKRRNHSPTARHCFYWRGRRIARRTNQDIGVSSDSPDRSTSPNPRAAQPGNRKRSGNDTFWHQRERVRYWSSWWACSSKTFLR